MKTYFNIRTNQGVEIVDQLYLSDFNGDAIAFDKEKIRLKKEYFFAGMNVYTKDIKTTRK